MNRIALSTARVVYDAATIEPVPSGKYRAYLWGHVDGLLRAPLCRALFCEETTEEACLTRVRELFGEHFDVEILSEPSRHPGAEESSPGVIIFNCFSQACS